MNKEVIQRTHGYLQVQHSAQKGHRKRPKLPGTILQFTFIRIDTECIFSQPTAGCCQFCLCELRIALTISKWLGRRLKNNILRDVKITCNSNFCISM